MNQPTRYLLLLLAFCLSRTILAQNLPIEGTQLREGEDPYLTKLYWQLNDSPMQQKLRSIKPFPVGVVYYQQRGHSLKDIQKEFQTIKDLGFTALKQIQLVAPDNPTDFEETVFRTAVETGLSPWYYGKGGWANIDEQLLQRLKIDIAFSEENMPEIQQHPKMMAHQNEVWRQRITRMKNKPPKPKGMGEPGRNNPWLPERLLPPFANWLETTYGDLETLKDAWNCGFTGKCTFSSFKEAAQLMEGEDFDQYGNGTGKLRHDFRRYRDAMKFQSELIVDNYQQTMDLYYRWDADEPERTGGHQLFENQAMNTWDLEAQAQTARIGGSFYSSIHLTHHFFLTDNEIILPVYWQARTVADMFKGGWAATWESTGGPTQWSGHQGYTVDGNTMSQLAVAYLAAGLKGIGLWMWNSRGEGWEVGEYALTDIQGEPSDRAVVMGNFSKKLQEHRFELWEAMDEPTVGILYSWENEAMLGRLSLGQYDLNTPVYKTNRDREFRQFHTEARLGISRALTSHHIPFEYVTERDLDAGLAQRYPIIYLPYVLTLKQKHISILKNYVAEGGRLVADFPVLMLDEYGRLNKYLEADDLTELFGLQVADYYHSFNRPTILKGDTLDTQYGIFKLKDATAIETFENGLPAILTHQYGKGEVLLFNFEASRMTYAPNNDAMERLLTYHTLGDIRPAYEVKNANHGVVMCRAAPEADHYFIINDGAAETIQIQSDVIDYGRAVNVYTDEVLKKTANGFEVEVAERMGVWVRVDKE
ncbi:MAG: beta-galactosidase trimerization domain-containing protein [Bacteroidota bacterium]